MGNPDLYPRSSSYLVFGSAFAFVSSVLLLISFASPYWLESYEETYADFVRLGLWDVCFRNYRHPPYQYDQKFDGCHYIYSEIFQSIRDWLQPGWFMFVQSMMALALLFCLCGLVFISLVLMRYLLKWEVPMLVTSFIFQCITALPTFLAISVFGGLCYDRSWILYPNFNHLSWAYAFAVIACFGHGVSAVFLILESFRARDRRRRANTLVYNMQPRF